MKKKLYPLLITIFIQTMFSINNYGQESPKSGDLIITEFMANPSAVSDTRGEWFELLNVSGSTILLDGLLVKDEGTNHFTITGDEPILLPSGHYFLLARNGDPGENGGITPDYIYSNFTLGNSEDEIILCLSEEIILDQINYDSDWRVMSGASLELDPEFLESGVNGEPDKWNHASTPFGEGDLGSPGKANSSASTLDQKAVIEKLEIYPNPCFDIINCHVKLQEKAPVEVSLINLIGQEIPVYENAYCDEVSLRLDTDWMTKGVWILKINFSDRTEIRKVLVY